jgi:hypothetical protein
MIRAVVLDIGSVLRVVHVETGASIAALERIIRTPA